MELLEEGKPIEGGFMEGLAAEIVAEYAPKTDTFDVVLNLGDEPRRVPFRRPVDGKELDDIRKGAAAHAKMLMPGRSGKRKPLPPGLENNFVADAEVIAKVYLVTTLAQDASLKSEANVFWIYRKAWTIFNSILEQIDLALSNASNETESKDFSDEKKGSSPIVATDP